MKKTSVLLALIITAVPFSSNADCFDDAAAYHGVNAWVLRGIASVESSFNPYALNKNSNGSFDVGLAQINSVHLKELEKYGIFANDLYNPCKSVHVAAWLLRKKINKYGNTWTAVGAYHSETPHKRDAYAAKVRSKIASWGVR